MYSHEEYLRANAHLLHCGATGVTMTVQLAVYKSKPPRLRKQGINPVPDGIMPAKQELEQHFASGSVLC